MKRVLLAVVAITLAMSARPNAHQLDEYLQAARIGFARDRIVLELDLTPGANIAGEIVAAVDGDGDGVVRPLEAQAYGEAVMGDLDLTFDGRPVRLTLETIEVPAVSDMQRGLGTMRLIAAGRLSNVRVRTGHLRFTNRHHPATSVYLANALVPGDRDVQVVAQRRDRRQQQLDVEYTIASRGLVHLIWALFGVTVMGSRIAARRRRAASGTGGGA